jgi:hypothetical protein
MEGSREMAAISFAVLVVLAYVIACAVVVNPLLQKNFIILDDAVALYIDTLASVEKGEVKIPLERGSVNRIEIAYKKEDKKEGIPDAGWYVIVTYRLLGDQTETSASRINTYPQGADLETNIFQPNTVCITKEFDEEQARVKKC